MPLFRRRNKAGSPQGPVVEMNPHHNIPGVPRPGQAMGSRPTPSIPGTASHTPRQTPAPEKPRSYNDGKSEEHLKAPSSEFHGYNNRQVGEAKDNAMDNANRFGGPVTTAHIKDALKRLNGR